VRLYGYPIDKNNQKVKVIELYTHEWSENLLMSVIQKALNYSTKLDIEIIEIRP